MSADQDFPSKKYLVIQDVVKSELSDSTGLEVFHAHIQKPAMAATIAKFTPPVFQSREHLQHLIDDFAGEFIEQWNSEEFAEQLKQHPTGMLINVETGDIPDFIDAGFPFGDGTVFNYDAIDSLCDRAQFTLDDLLTVIAGKPFDEMDYFEFADLIYFEFADVYAEWEFAEIDEAICDAKQIIVASVGLISLIRSLKAWAKASGTTIPIWASTSESCFIMGSLNRVI